MGKKRLLIADPIKSTLEEVLSHPKAKNYLIEAVTDGPSALKAVENTTPDLLVVELMLPKMHGIEVLKTVKSHPKTAKMGVIVTSFYTMVQDFRAALEGQADYVLEKPLDLDRFFDVVEQYFSGTLKAESYSLSTGQGTESQGRYAPVPMAKSHYIRFWGTRGSVPVSGARYYRMGGNTCCLEVRYGDDLVIIDAGTGIRELGSEIAASGKKDVHLFIGHTHWDHVTGFPFFAPMYDPETNVHLYAPVGYDRDTKELFTEMLAYAFFPVRLDEMQAKFHIHQMRDGDHYDIGNLSIETHYTHHPGSTLGFKIRSPTHTIGYITDNEFLSGYHGHPDAIGHGHSLLRPHESLIRFLSDCDLLIHEAQYFPDEYEHKVGWGHSSISNATVLIKHIGCHEWIVTHHDPQHSDKDLAIKLQMHQDILHDCHMHTHTRFAFDGMILPL